MSARDQILGGIRSTLTNVNARDRGEAIVAARLNDRKRNLLPDRINLDHDGKVALFCQKAEAVDATVANVASLDDVPKALVEYLKGQNLPARVKRAPDPALDSVPWDSAPMLEIERGAAVDQDLVSVTTALAAVAETGTLMIASGGGEDEKSAPTKVSGMSPSTLNFLPDTHVVVLPADRVVGPYEDGWDRVRDIVGLGKMPRTVNMITGPSRTGDIEQKVQLGAHGPRRLHIILVSSDG